MVEIRFLCNVIDTRALIGPCSHVTSHFCQSVTPGMSPAPHYSAYSNWSLATYPFFSSDNRLPFCPWKPLLAHRHPYRNVFKKRTPKLYWTYTSWYLLKTWQYTSSYTFCTGEKFSLLLVSAQTWPNFFYRYIFPNDDRLSIKNDNLENWSSTELTRIPLLTRIIVHYR